ncbi:coiled-coil domain-containing protein 14 isoform X1 [Hirundo rustica]|uniref:coiled-coil domain-containing protein 14 isoform X1 n=2 Tax=Hirundo rustica TaxID=43150 RepID=UPI001A944EBA|nr:coiled-coil domain-containing protein 14 isoform X1 [Hirundo rustica]
MAAPGAARSRKALSSGRLSGAAKVTNGRNRFGLRKGCHSDVEFYSTECDNQVDTIHNGLHHCATLLKNILQKEATGRETVHKQPGKTTTFKFTSKPLLAKENTSKKKGLKRIITPAPVQKEIVPISNRKVASSTTPSTEKELSSAAQNQMVQSIHVPCSEHSPGAYQKLYEHVQTQMSLMTGQPPQKNNEIPAVTPCPASNQGCQNVTASNYQVPTSTSALSLQHSANPLSIQSGVPVDSANERVPEMGGPVVCPAVSAAAAAAQIQSGAALPGGIPYTAPGASTPALIPTSSDKEMAPSQEQQMKEADLMWCIQALLQSHEMLTGRTEQRSHRRCPAKHDGSCDTEEDTPEEHSEDTVSEDELNVLDVSPVREPSCKTRYVKKVLKSGKESPEETAHKVRTVKYLMGELRALVTDQDDSEMLRLMCEIEDSVSLLPAVVGSTNIQAEIALALQPLRSENAQLRRRLRILNQQLREQESSEKTSGHSCNYELVSLQSLNMMLQSQLKESQKGLDSLQAKNEELLKIIEGQKEENKHLAKSIQDKEEELLENKQHYDIHSTKLKIEVEEALGTVKSLQFKLEASEKENKILGITLRQRDAEVKRLRELTRTLQGSMAKLLSDLTRDNVRPKPEKTLSKSLLEDHEKQMQPELFPGSTSVMTYLRTLEMDHILIDTDLQFSNKIGEVDLPYEKFAAEGSKINSTVTEEPTSAPRGPPAPLKQDAETGSDSGTLLDDQTKLDETIYIPLTSSASKKQQPVSGRSSVLPQSRGACQRLDYHCELPSSVQQYGCEDPALLDKLNSGYSVKKPGENTLEVTEDKAKPEGDKAQVRPRGIASGAAKDFTDEPDQPQPGTSPRASMPFPAGISQKTGSKAADFSCISFDDFSGRSDWSTSSFSTFTSRDEEDFKNSLAALDANIARLQRTLQSNIRKQ